MSVFIRILNSPIPAKGEDLRCQIATLNQERSLDDVFFADPESFNAIPGTPFAYWVDKKVLSLFGSLKSVAASEISVQYGASTKNDFRFLRLWWEVNSQLIGIERRWILYAKGGHFSPYYADVQLLVNWANNAQEIRNYLVERYPYLAGQTDWVLHPESSYFLPGLTWASRTTSKISFRPLPCNCIFTSKGPAAFVQGQADLMFLLALANSLPFFRLIELQLGAATEAARSYEVGIIQQTPIPSFSPKDCQYLTGLAQKAYILAREPYLSEETTHVFSLPVLMISTGSTLKERLQKIAQGESERVSEMDVIQTQINIHVAELYGVPELAGGSDDHQIERSKPLLAIDEAILDEQDEDDEAETTSTLHPPSLVANLLSWCVGAAFGRWNVCYALHPENLPSLPGPFDSLPVCPPGMLTGVDGLPLTSSPEGYPLPVAWDGLLVDDLGHPRDIVLAVQHVIHLLWPEIGESIETEACQILGVPDLRAWFRDPKGFFAYHIKRYSKSRRKAPIYWLLQSAKRNYGIWLYYPRLNPDSLFRAGREYADAKLSLETGRLKDYHTGLPTAAGSARKVQERKIATQEALIAELKSFQKDLDVAAMLELKPDLNDGVLLNIAPLYALVPWKEAERTWQELLRGKYEWSSISKWLRQKGQIKS